MFSVTCLFGLAVSDRIGVKSNLHLLQTQTVTMYRTWLNLILILISHLAICLANSDIFVVTFTLE